MVNPLDHADRFGVTFVIEVVEEPSVGVQGDG